MMMMRARAKSPLGMRRPSHLAARPGETVPRDALAGSVELSNERTIDVQINRLRRKIEADPANPIHLQTVRGIGYRLFVD